MRTKTHFLRAAAGACVLLTSSGLVMAQPAEDGGNGRRPQNGEPTVLAFRNVKVDQIVPFIVEATGKVVMPQPDVLTRSITVLNDQPIPREQALDLVFLALAQNGIAVVESGGIITLRDITEIDRQDVPVIGPTDTVLTRGDLGTIAEKVFHLRYGSAENMGEILKDAIPKHAKLTVDADSNQLAIMGNISLLQRMERLITSLDRAPSDTVIAETFRLRYADAEQIKANIEELFSASTGNRNNNQGNNNNRGGNQGNQQGNQGRPNFGNFFGPQGGQQGQQGSAQPSANLRVTANTQQNSVTVSAEPSVIEQVREQIEKFWDLPLPDEAVIPKIYDLVNSDPVKVRDLLEGLFGRATTGTGGGQNQQRTGSSQGVGRLAGQFSFEAIPEAGRLVVVAKSPDNLAVIDKIIEDLDRPQTSGLPAIVELKHASAEELAEQLNTLLSQDGTLAQIRRAESGLSDSSSTASPFATTTQTDNGQQQTTSSDTMQFWWQRSRPPTDSRGASNLIGQVRIVPVWRQNALMVLAPPEYKSSTVELIQSLDRPGRQVLIKAVVAEVSRDDATALGLRWSSQAITPANPDNSIGVGANATAQEGNIFGQLFDTSVLDADANVNLLLQALNEKTAVNILSEPKIFTSDNQEAEFFSGQDIPFVTDTQTTDQGNVVNSFDYRAVGIQLRARPRITVNGDVDLRVNLELSSIAPGGQTLFGGFIVDRRETTTQLIVQDGRTVVMSGILRTEASKIKRKVPLLGDIPLLGWLFSSIENGTSETELLVFITPMVVNNEQDSKRVNDPDLRQLQLQREQLRPNDTEAAPRDPGEGDQATQGETQ